MNLPLCSCVPVFVGLTFRAGGSQGVQENPSSFPHKLRGGSSPSWLARPRGRRPRLRRGVRAGAPLRCRQVHR